MKSLFNTSPKIGQLKYYSNLNLKTVIVQTPTVFHEISHLTAVRVTSPASSNKNIKAEC